jgi:hypothetical protein
LGSRVEGLSFGLRVTGLGLEGKALSFRKDLGFGEV